MRKILIKNGLVVTIDPQDRIIRNGSIYIEDDRIKEVGPASQIGDKDGVDVIDAKGKIVLPGFISCHNHLYSAVVRSIPYSGFEKEDFSFYGWMERFWLPLLEDRVTHEQLYIGTKANLLEHIRSGITTTSDTAEGPYALPGVLDAVDQGAMESGARAVLSFETTGRVTDQNAQLGIDENVKFYKKAKARNGRVTSRIGVHTTYTTTPELLKQVRAVADDLGAGVMMHHLDDRWHNFDTTKRFGKRPTRYLEDIGFLRPDLVLFHCSYIDPIEDPAIFKKYDVKVAHQAESNAIFGFWPNMIPLLKAGVTVGFGTDGMTHSMFEVMRTGQIIHRIRYENLELFPDYDVLKMATIEAAKVMQLEKEIGSLEPGKKADITLLRDRSTVPLFEDNVANYIVGTCERHDVDTILIDGDVVLKHGEFQNVDEEETLAKCRETALDLWKRNGWPTPDKPHARVYL
ncbi:MAG: amidohydrolase family protein [Anaerolineae bacterium]|nr:amidohydrolase family protein [Anaerolineae bacterium]